MDKAAVLDIITQLKELLEARSIKVHKIVLYGSYSKGTHNVASDIDLVIISDDFSSKDYWERIDLFSEIIYLLFQPIEVTALTLAEWNNEESMIVKYAQQGEVVYAASA